MKKKLNWYSDKNQPDQGLMADVIATTPMGVNGFSFRRIYLEFKAKIFKEMKPREWRELYKLRDSN